MAIRITCHRRRIDPGIDGEGGGQIDVANVNIVVYSVETEGLRDFSGSEGRAVHQRPVVISLKVTGVSVAGPPGQHVQRRRRA